MLKVLVTGYTGFIGSHLAKSLLGQGHIVYGTGAPGENSVPGVIDLGCHFHDIPNGILKRTSVIFHQAANNDTQSSGDSMMATNCHASTILFKNAFAAGCRNFVYASTAAIYGNRPTPWSENHTEAQPLTDYAKSKLAFENFANEFSKKGCNVVGLRYCNVYGPGEDHKGKRASMVHQLSREIMKYGSAPIFEDGQQRRDWVYVQDVVRANLLAAKRGFRPFVGSEILNISSGRAITFNKLVEVINAKLHTGVSPIYIDNPFPSTYQERTGSEIDLARSVIGWKPRYGIRRGVDAMISHRVSNPGYLASVG